MNMRIYDVCCNEFIQNRVVQRAIKVAQCFTVLADVTTNVEEIKEILLCIRYIDTEIETNQGRLFLIYTSNQRIGYNNCLKFKIMHVNIQIKLMNP